MERKDLQQIIDNAIKSVVDATGQPIEDDVRRALLEPGIRHLDEITRDIDQGAIDEAFLEDLFQRLLIRASLLTEGTGPIRRRALTESMESECNYLGWC